MKKIPTLFVRCMDGDRALTEEPAPGTEAVFAGRALATEKYDGTACWVHEGQLYKRFDGRAGRLRPEGFIPAQDAADQWHWEGWRYVTSPPFALIPPESTYELVGPKVQGNPYGLLRHCLWKHGADLLQIAEPLTFAGLRAFLERTPHIEGIVWWLDGVPIAKLKRRDLGLQWPVLSLARP